jgi:hypothetical protein
VVGRSWRFLGFLWILIEVRGGVLLGDSRLVPFGSTINVVFFFSVLVLAEFEV